MMMSFLVSYSHGGNLNVSVDVEAVVLAGQHHAPVVHQGHVETLGVLHLTLQSRDELALLGEHGQVEVIMIVCYSDLSGSIDTHSDRIVGDSFTADLPEEVSIVIKDFDAVGSIIRDEYLLSVIYNHAVGELQMLGAAELVQHVTELVEDDHTHHLALYYYDPALVVHTDSSGVLEDVGAELPHELTVLVVDLDLVGRGPLCDDDISARLDYSYPVRVEQLTVTLSNLTELELEPSLLVEYLDPMIVGIRHNNIVLSIDGDPAWLGELSLEDAELPELAVVDHLLPLDLALGRVERGHAGGVGQRERGQAGVGHRLGGQVDHITRRLG